MSKFLDEFDHLLFDVLQWRTNPSADWFTIHLFNLMTKADPTNRKKLRDAFPMEHRAWLAWYCAEDEMRWLRTLQQRFVWKEETKEDGSA